jgi:hypothetical protein
MIEIKNIRFPRNKLIKLFVAALVSSLSLWVLIRLVLSSKDQLSDLHVHVTAMSIFITFFLFFSSVLLTGFVWGLILNTLESKRRISIYSHLVIYIATSFVGRLPGGIWNVVGRVAWYEQLGIRKRITTFASGIQWIMIIWSGTIFLILLLPLALPSDLSKTMALIGIALFITLIMNPKTIKFLLKQFLKDDDVIHIHYKDILIWLTIYLIIWLLGGTIFFIVASSVTSGTFFGVKEWLFSLITWAAGTVSGTIVTFLPSGLGLTELVTSLVLTLQMPSSVSVAVALIMRILLTIFDFILSLIFFFIAKISHFENRKLI